MDGGRGCLPCANAERRQILSADIGEQKGYWVNGQIEQGRQDNQEKKEAADETLPALRPPFPQSQSYQSPDTIAESIEQQQQESAGDPWKRSASDSARPDEERCAKKN